MGWIFFPESGATGLPSRLGCNRSATWKWSLTAKRSSSKGCPREGFVWLPCGMTFGPLPVPMSRERSTSLSEASRARTSVSQDVVRAWMESEAVYFSKWNDLCASSNPRLFSLKTRLLFGLVEARSWGKDWPRSAMIVDGTLYPLPPSERLISATGGSFLPTLTARDWKSGKASAETMARNSRPLSEFLGGLINPTWAELFMKLPAGWTEIGRAEFRALLLRSRGGKTESTLSATPSSRSKRAKPSLGSVD